MKEWFKTSLGASIVQAEVDKCAQLIPSDYYAGGLQVGMSNVDFLSPSGVVNRYMIENSDHFCKVEDQLPDYHYVVSESDALPFPQKSQDLIILPHTLDFCENPHEVLRQVDQILEPEGCLAITGFNFASFYGAIKLFKRKKNPPWSGHFYSVRRVGLAFSFGIRSGGCGNDGVSAAVTFRSVAPADGVSRKRG